jgi:hypothetical protein
VHRSQPFYELAEVSNALKELIYSGLLNHLLQRLADEYRLQLVAL